MQVFRWMKTLKNYCARTDIYNMLIRLHARHNLVDQARGLFFEMQQWRYLFSLNFIFPFWLNFRLGGFNFRL